MGGLCGGPSGCGKTTLVKLLLKFYIPEQGTVSIDGHDLRDMDAAVLRDHIGYVPQEIYIFAGTIAENIALRSNGAFAQDLQGKIGFGQSLNPWWLRAGRSPYAESAALKEGLAKNSYNSALKTALFSWVESYIALREKSLRPQEHS